MTPFEQFLAAAKFEATEHVPVVGAITSFYMETVTPGLNALEEKERTLRMLLHGAELFPDIPLLFLVNPTPALYPEMLRQLRNAAADRGAKRDASSTLKSDFVLDDIETIVIPDPKTSADHRRALDDIRWFLSNIPQDLKERLGYCNGLIRFENPFDTLCEAVGSAEWFLKIATEPEFVLAAMEKFTEASLRGALALAEQIGAPRWVILAEDFPGCIRRADFERFVLPFHSRIFDAFPNAVKLLHNDSNTTHLLDVIGDCGADIFHFGPQVDVAAAKQKLDKKMALMGNVAPMGAFANGSPSEARAAIERCLETGAHGGGFVLATGGEVNPGTDPARINLMRVMARTMGRYR